MLSAKAEFAGTLADPKITGRADLTAGRFEDYPTGLKLRDAVIGAALNTDTIAVDRFSASDNQKGTVTGQGQVSLARGGASDLQIKLNNFRLVDNDTATANTTGSVTIVRGADGKAKIAGALEVVSGEINAAAKTSPDIPTIDVVERNRPFNLDEQLQPPPAGQQGVALDITLTAARGLLIKGRGLNLDMSLDAKVAGTSGKPILSGVARVVRGDYDFGGQRFAFDNRGTVQLSDDPKLIRLDLTATREAPGLTAVINIQGTAAKPQITLSSTPVLPNDEVLSQVLFGASASQLSPLQAAQLASALTALASGGGFDVIGGLRSFARLDRLALVGGGATGVSVAGGKYIGDRVYVQVAGGGREGPSAEVEYRITHNLSLASKLANVQPAATTNTTPGTVVQTGSTISIRWRKDFRDPPPKPTN
jgi:translocation and assembly module TamB